jgi:hypothetical protein
LSSGEAAVTLEEIKCFCKGKRATVHVESPVGTITFLPTGVCIGPTVFAWSDDAPPELGSYKESLERGDKFVVQPKFGNEKELKPEKFEQLLKASFALSQKSAVRVRACGGEV